MNIFYQRQPYKKAPSFESADRQADPLSAVHDPR
jgi:hypothetical protein